MEEAALKTCYCGCVGFDFQCAGMLRCSSHLPILIVLYSMKAFVSPIFSRGSFLAGIGFGIPAGFLEEIGWTGYAFPKMCGKMSPLTAGMLLGLLWGSWHLPVIDFLGTATPHGRYLAPYFLAFIV